MRLFIALDIDDDIRARIARFVDGVNAFVPDARWAKAESLHITLKFIGEQPEAAVEKIKQALSAVRATTSEIYFRGYGFFPSAKAARVFWVGTDGGPNLSSFAAAVDEKLLQLGIPKEEHAFNAHLTLARSGRSASPRQRENAGPNRVLQHLQEKLTALSASEFGTMTAREFFLYQSQTSQSGSHYTKLAGFALR